MTIEYRSHETEIAIWVFESHLARILWNKPRSHMKKIMPKRPNKNI